MKSRLFGWRATGFAIGRGVMLAFWIGVAIVTLTNSVAGQGGESQAPVLVQPPIDTTPKPWTGKRLPDGQPDVQSGIWRAVNGGTGRLDNPIATNFAFRPAGEPPPKPLPSRIVDPPDGRVPYQPWAAALKKQQEIDLENPTRPDHIDPQARCLVGMPRLGWYVSGYRILQPPGFFVIMWDLYHQYRVIPVDGSPHIGPDIKLWMGDGRGHWEGNTLVVDTTNLNGKTRLTSSGDFLSDKAHLTERFIFVDGKSMYWEATITDPTVYTRPWTMRVGQARGADDEMWEDSCHEGDLARPSAPHLGK